MNNIIKTIIFLVLFIFCIQCGNISHERLIKSSKEFITEDGGHIDEKYGSTQGFEKHFFKVKYIEDTIYAEAMQYVNACGNAIANINIKNDTIILYTFETSKVVCASANYYKFKYWINNPDNKKYIILQSE